MIEKRINQKETRKYGLRKKTQKVRGEIEEMKT